MEKEWRNQLADSSMHIVPGVDSGAATMEEALEEVEAAIAQGVNTILVTPHSAAFDTDAEKVQIGFGLLQKEVAAKGLKVFLYPGSEVLCGPETVGTCVRRLKSGRYPTLAGSNHVLIEFDQETYSFDEAMYCIDEIREAGYTPIIAHVERYGFLDASDVRDLKDKGAKIQILAYSVVNEPNATVSRLANELLAKKLVDFVGTDAHRMDFYPPNIWEGARAIEELCGDTYARKILVENTRQLILEKSSQ